MNRRGFTLIELLAVIVILAIIALIATPIILGIIRDSQESANMRSVEGFGSTVQSEAMIWMTQPGNQGEPSICLQASDTTCAIDARADQTTAITGARTVTYGGARVNCTGYSWANMELTITGCDVEGNTPNGGGTFSWTQRDGATIVP